METTNNRKEINGNLFIIPNAPTGKTEWMMKNDQWTRYRQARDRELFPYGLEASEEANVEIWVESPEVDNWVDHWSQFYTWLSGEEKPRFNSKEYNEWQRRAFANKFPHSLPIEVLRGLKEGDTLTLRRFDGLVVNLKVAQLSGRYCNFGKFEDLLEDLCPSKPNPVGWDYIEA